MKMVHVTINTGDLERSIRFYKEVLGLEIVQDLREFGLHIVFLSSSEAGTRVELIENVAEKFSGSGISIGFDCGDAEQKREELLEKGYEPSLMISPQPQVKFFFLSDPSGVRIQLIGQ